jgi:hypothetical protein
VSAPADDKDRLIPAAIESVVNCIADAGWRQ